MDSITLCVKIDFYSDDFGPRVFAVPLAANSHSFIHSLFSVTCASTVFASKCMHFKHNGADVQTLNLILPTLCWECKFVLIRVVCL